MERRNTCLTRELASAVREAATQAPDGSHYGATFESPALLRDLHKLASVTTTGAFRLFIAVSGDDGLGQVYDLGVTGGDFTSDVVPDGKFPFVGPAPSDLACLLISLEGDNPASAGVRVERFEQGLRHGFTADGPAVVEAGGDRFECGYAHMGVDVSELVANPILSVADVTRDASVGSGVVLSLDPRHAQMASMVAAAEARGEAVSLQTPGLPDLACVRMPGGSSYDLVDAATLDGLTADWAAEGAAHVAVKLAAGPSGRECHLLRRVGGLVAGDNDGLPGACVSVLPEGGAPSEATMVISRRKLPTIEAQPERASSSPRFE